MVHGMATNSASALWILVGRLIVPLVVASALTFKLGHECFLALGIERFSEMFNHKIDIIWLEVGIGQGVHQVREGWLGSFK